MPDKTINVNEHPNVKRAGHLNNLTMPFLLYFTAGLFLFLGFCFLRNKFKNFYIPKRKLKKNSKKKKKKTINLNQKEHNKYRTIY